MGSRAFGYFGLPFKGYHSMTQGDLLSPMLFNVVVYAIIRHWVTFVEPTVDVLEGLGLSIRELAAYFYAEDGLVASIKPERLQREFDILTGLFDQVGLSMNTRKTVIMECQPYHAPGQMYLEEYKRRTTGAGSTLSYQ